MTAADVLAAWWRRWPVLLVGLVLTAGLAWRVHQEPGVWAAQADVVFLTPATGAQPNKLTSGSSGTISTAGLVERMVDRTHPQVETTGAVSLVGQGVRDGWSIQLPNAGGQWSFNFNQPLLRVQVTGPTSVVVTERLTAIVDRIRGTLARLQRAYAVVPYLRISTSTAPSTPQPVLMQGRPVFALGTTILLGLALTGAAAVGADRVAPRLRPLRTWRPRRRRSPATA